MQKAALLAHATRSSIGIGLGLGLGHKKIGVTNLDDGKEELDAEEEGEEGGGKSSSSSSTGHGAGGGAGPAAAAAGSSRKSSRSNSIIGALPSLPSLPSFSNLKKLAGGGGGGGGGGNGSTEIGGSGAYNSISDSPSSAPKSTSSIRPHFSLSHSAPSSLPLSHFHFHSHSAPSSSSSDPFQTILNERTYQALWSFPPPPSSSSSPSPSSDELSFEKGDIIKRTRIVNDDWWIGVIEKAVGERGREREGKRGMFPRGFVGEVLREGEGEGEGESPFADDGEREEEEVGMGM